MLAGNGQTNLLMVRRLLGALGVLAIASSAGAQTPLRDVKVPRLLVPKQLPPCAVLQVINYLEATAGRPISLEVSWEETSCWSQVSGRPTPFVGAELTSVGDILDQLLASDRHYRWQDMDGVVVVRPIAAWRENDHFLHRRVAEFTVVDGHLANALAAISVSLHPWAFGNPDFLLVATPMLPPIQTRFSGGTVLDAVNAIVASRDDLGWTVLWCPNGSGPRIHIVSRGHATLVGAAPGNPQCTEK